MDLENPGTFCTKLIHMHISNEEVVIPMTSWRDFEDEKPVNVEVPEGVILEVGDTIHWSLAQFEGICSVVSVIKKN